jgi:hypothetical protein
MYLPCGFDRPIQSNAWASIYQQVGPFAFSREHADWEVLRKRGRMKGL